MQLHSTGWRHTVPFPPKLFFLSFFFFTVYVSGCGVLVFLYIYFFVIDVFLTYFLPIKCTVLELQKSRFYFFGCSYEADAKYFVN